jgi:ABC-type transporter Mla maintaining outer membrane lipid asymmetry permease subunit MlaE
MWFRDFHVKMGQTHQGSHHMEAVMKNTLLVAGLSSLVASLVLFTLGYTILDYQVGSTQVLVYPAGFFALLGLVLFYAAFQRAMKI